MRGTRRAICCRHILLSALPLLCILAVATVVASPGQQVATGTINGTVLAARQGIPLVGAKVAVDGTALTDITDEHGRFVIHSVPAGDAGLTVTYLRQSYPRSEIVSVGPGQTVRISVTLPVDSVTGLERVVVTGARLALPLGEIPAPVSVVDRGDLNVLPSTNLAQVVGRLPGLYLYDVGGTGSEPAVNARGFTGGGENDYLLVIVDGVRANDLGTGRIDWREVPLTDIERVELVRGPASALYGDTAVAGVLQILTRQPATPHLTVDLSAGSFDRSGTAIRYGSGSGKWWYRTALDNGQGHGYRARSDWNQFGVTAAVGTAFDAGRWELSLRYNHDEHDLPGPLPAFLFDEDPKRSLLPFDRVDRERITAAWNVRYKAGRWTLDGTASIRHQDDNEVETVLIETNARRFRSLTAAIEHRAATYLDSAERCRLLLGVEASRGDFASRYFAVDEAGNATGILADGDGTRTSLAAYSQLDMSLAERLSLVAGVRGDYVRDAFDEVIQPTPAAAISHSALAPKVGLVWRIGADNRLYVDAARTFRVPTPSQLFDQRRIFGMSITNPGLRPQTGTSYEIGTKIAVGATSVFEISAYQIDLDNEIGFDPAIFRLRNIGQTQHRGIESSFQTDLSHGLHLGVNYTFTDAESRVPENDGAPLDNVPRHTANVALRWIGQHSSVAAAYRAVRDVTIDSAGIVSLDDYDTVDLRLRRSLGQFALELDLLNALDAQYATWGFISPMDGSSFLYPAPGRSIHVALEWDYEWARGKE